MYLVIAITGVRNLILLELNSTSCMLYFSWALPVLLHSFLLAKSEGTLSLFVVLTTSHSANLDRMLVSRPNPQIIYSVLTVPCNLGELRRITSALEPVLIEVGIDLFALLFSLVELTLVEYLLLSLVLALLHLFLEARGVGLHMLSTDLDRMVLESSQPLSFV